MTGSDDLQVTPPVGARHAVPATRLCDPPVMRGSEAPSRTCSEPWVSADAERRIDQRISLPSSRFLVPKKCGTASRENIRGQSTALERRCSSQWGFGAAPVTVPNFFTRFPVAFSRTPSWDTARVNNGICHAHSQRSLTAAAPRKRRQRAGARPTQISGGPGGPPRRSPSRPRPGSPYDRRTHRKPATEP